MSIHIGDGIPLQHRRSTPLGFRLGLDEPVPVHVEQIMIGTTTRPGFVMFGSESVRVWHQALGDFKIVDEPIPSIGILHRVDDNNGVGHDVRYTCIILRGEQMVGR